MKKLMKWIAGTIIGIVIVMGSTSSTMLYDCYCTSISAPAGDSNPFTGVWYYYTPSFNCLPWIEAESVSIRSDYGSYTLNFDYWDDYRIVKIKFHSQFTDYWIKYSVTDGSCESWSPEKSLRTIM